MLQGYQLKTDGGDGRRMDGKWSEWDINSRRERMTGKKEYEGKKKKDREE